MDNKERILEKSEELFLRYGIKSVTMDDIARELGISKKTLYQYVDNKQDLLEQIFSCQLDKERSFMQAVQEEATDAIDEILRIAKFVIRQLRRYSPTVMYDLQKYYKASWQKIDQLHTEYTYNLIRSNMEKGIAQGIYRENLNPDIIAKMFSGKNALVADEQIFPLREYDIETLFRQHMLYHINGIASAKGLQVLDEHMDRDLENVD